MTPNKSCRRTSRLTSQSV